MCPRCAASAPIGRIFCENCGATLRPIFPARLSKKVPLTTDAEHRRRQTISGRSVVLVFALCALADFVWSLLDRRSMMESATSAVLGLFGTAWYVIGFWASLQNDPDDPAEPARWVP
jgi:hypothetical protein